MDLIKFVLLKKFLNINKSYSRQFYFIFTIRQRSCTEFVHHLSAGREKVCLPYKLAFDLFSILLEANLEIFRKPSKACGEIINFVYSGKLWIPILKQIMIVSRVLECNQTLSIIINTFDYYYLPAIGSHRFVVKIFDYYVRLKLNVSL